MNDLSNVPVITGFLNRIIEERIMPSGSLRNNSGFCEWMKFPLGESSNKKLILILTNFDIFKKMIEERIQASFPKPELKRIFPSLPSSFPKIVLKKEGVDFNLYIGDPDAEVAAEWKWKKN